LDVKPFHILVVDDDDLAVLRVQRALGRTGHLATVTTASNGVEALEVLRGGQIPKDRLVILTDVSMPGMSGIELLHEIRMDPALAAIPVVFLTASTLASDRAAAYADHSAGYFLKPATAASLDDIVRCIHAYWATSELPGAAPKAS
jgi:CheY-like chemotaxis protein